MNSDFNRLTQEEQDSINKLMEEFGEILKELDLKDIEKITKKYDEVMNRGLFK